MDIKWDVVGFGIGQYVPFERLRVTLRKLTIFLLASIVILRPYSLKMLHRSFLIISTWRGVPLVTPRPSSLYKPKLLPYFALILCKRKVPTPYIYI